MACSFKLGDQVMAAPWLSDDDFFCDVHPGDVGIVIRVGENILRINWGRNVGSHGCGQDDVPDGYATWELAVNLTLAAENKEQIDISAPNLEDII